MLPERRVFWFLVYNALAFALQFAIGPVTDRLQGPRATLSAGLALAAAALLVPRHAVWLHLVLTGLGNAMFHVGAGTLAMCATRWRAGGPGLFIAPGAVGLALGGWLGLRAPQEAAWAILAGLALFACLVPLLPRGATVVRTDEPEPAPSTHVAAVVALLLVSIAVRSLLGLRVAGQFRTHADWVVPLAVAAFAGKAMGGILGDLLGWIRVSVPALALSTGLLIVAEQNLLLAGLCVVLFQVVTGITLAALFRLLPSRPATSFGLSCLALCAGALPVLLRVELPPLGGLPIHAWLGVVSVATVWTALSLQSKATPARLSSGPAARRRDGRSPMKTRISSLRSPACSTSPSCGSALSSGVRRSMPAGGCGRGRLCADRPRAHRRRLAVVHERVFGSLPCESDVRAAGRALAAADGCGAHDLRAGRPVGEDSPAPRRGRRSDRFDAAPRLIVDRGARAAGSGATTAPCSSR